MAPGISVLPCLPSHFLSARGPVWLPSWVPVTVQALHTPPSWVPVTLQALHALWIHVTVQALHTPPSWVPVTIQALHVGLILGTETSKRSSWNVMQALDM